MTDNDIIIGRINAENERLATKEKDFWDEIGRRLKINTEVKCVSLEEMKTLDDEFKGIKPRCYTINTIKKIELCPTQP
jgi:hypothetical protein